MKPKPIAWRAYQVTIPKVLADRLEHAVDRQSRLENRPISLSEFLCWRIMEDLNRLEGVTEEDHDG